MATTSSVTKQTLVGRVKWFNSSSGFGFITITDDSSESVNGADIFVHHSSISVSYEQYRYLVQGEYVEFSLVPTTQGPHQYQAVNVSGIKGGKLMCETRRDVKADRTNYRETKGPVTGTDSASQEASPVVSRKRPSPKNQAKVRGEGPREGGEGAEWTYVVKSNRPNEEATKQPTNTRIPRVKSTGPRRQQQQQETK